MSERRAKDWAEYDEAVDVIRWIQARGREMAAAGQEDIALGLVPAVKAIERRFTAPEGPRPALDGDRVAGALAKARSAIGQTGRSGPELAPTPRSIAMWMRGVSGDVTIDLAVPEDVEALDALCDLWLTVRRG